MRRMKIFVAVLAACYIAVGAFGTITVRAEELPVEAPVSGPEDEVPEEAAREAQGEAEVVEKPESVEETPAGPKGKSPEEAAREAQGEAEASQKAESGEETPARSEDEMSEEAAGEAQGEAETSQKAESGEETLAGLEDETPGVSGPLPAFQANVEWSAEGWIVKGLFKDFTTDTILVQPMCSTDGEMYRDCGQAWNLQWLLSEEEWAQEKLWNQRCLYDSEEPFRSYLSGELDRFYIKLCVVREGGTAFETQAAVIERKEQPSVPEELDMSARFAPSMLVREGRPPQICYYGRYQMTVREESDEVEILALLPDVLPVEVKIHKGDDLIGSDIVDCPVRWKSLSLPKLTAGESVTVADAAEELMVPAGTVLHTQTGIYRVEEPIGMNQYGIVTDEVRLVLNVVAKDGRPEGMLSEEKYGLEMVFSLKPTGARDISAYFFREGDTAWTQIEGLSLTQMVNEQPSTANSGYALVLGKDQEPYLPYRKAQEAGEKPTPFLVGVKVEGGVYDGRELVLAWPDSYEPPLRLPKVGGSGGNEGNAGSDDRGDSTEGGQRPGLPEKEPDEPSSGGPKEPDEPSSGEPSKPDKPSVGETVKPGGVLPGEPKKPDGLSSGESKEPEEPLVGETVKPGGSSSGEPKKPVVTPSGKMAGPPEKEPESPTALVTASVRETAGVSAVELAKASEKESEEARPSESQTAVTTIEQSGQRPDVALVALMAGVLAVFIAGIAIRKRRAV